MRLTTCCWSCPYTVLALALITPTPMASDALLLRGAPASPPEEAPAGASSPVALQTLRRGPETAAPRAGTSAPRRLPPRLRGPLRPTKPLRIDCVDETQLLLHVLSLLVRTLASEWGRCCSSRSAGRDSKVQQGTSCCSSPRAAERRGES